MFTEFANSILSIKTTRTGHNTVFIEILTKTGIVHKSHTTQEQSNQFVKAMQTLNPSLVLAGGRYTLDCLIVLNLLELKTVALAHVAGKDALKFEYMSGPAEIVYLSAAAESDFAAILVSLIRNKLKTHVKMRSQICNSRPI